MINLNKHRGLRMKKLKLATFTVIAALSLSGCSNPIQVEQNRAALESIVNNPPTGFTLAETRKPTCGIDYCTTNYGYLFTAEPESTDRTEFCDWFIPWAWQNGADSWMTDPNYIAIPIEGHEPTAQLACIGGMNFSMLGGKPGTPRWMIGAGPTMIMVETIMNREGSIDDERMVYHEWDEGLALLYNGTRVDMSALDVVNSYRLANPSEDPNSPETIKKALEALPTIPLEIEPKIDVIEDDSGNARFLFVHNDGTLLDRCISIKPFSEDYFKLPNPTTGFIGMYITEDQKFIDEFGFMKSDSCPEL